MITEETKAAIEARAHEYARNIRYWDDEPLELGYIAGATYTAKEVERLKEEVKKLNIELSNYEEAQQHIHEKICSELNEMSIRLKLHEGFTELCDLKITICYSDRDGYHLQSNGVPFTTIEGVNKLKNALEAYREMRTAIYEASDYVQDLELKEHLKKLLQKYPEL